MVRSTCSVAPAERSKSIFLYGSFLIMFIIFSATSYQYDYYIDILLPFAGIISAKYLHDVLKNRDGLSWVPGVQRGLSILLLLFILGLSILAVEKNLLLIFTVVLCVGILICAVRTRYTDPLSRAIIYPVLAMNILFLFVGTIFLTAAIRRSEEHTSEL